jgi:hypothetical protein
MKLLFYPLLILSSLLIGCQSGWQEATQIPPACDLLTTDLLGEILREPVRNPKGANAGRGELSACTFTLPGRSLEDYLGIYIFDAAPTKDMLSLKNIADKWQSYNAGADYVIEDNAKYPMAWFPGEHKVYPSTFIVLFKKATLVITGTSKDDAKSIVFRAMVQYKLDN